MSATTSRTSGSGRARLASCAPSPATRGADILHAQHVLTSPAAVARRRGPGRARRLHRARLLAGLLLGHAHPRPGVAHAVPGVLGVDDDAVRAPAGRRGLAARAALHPLHARQPGAQAAGARRGRAPWWRSARPSRATCASGRSRWRSARIEVIPNPVDVAAIRRAAAGARRR
ncbi:MAG: hypothetical protein MZV64_13840 [Ignavibacteriales bacterium]|nr:hypothetical protein [Ignavibacteriales bacterium]